MALLIFSWYDSPEDTDFRYKLPCFDTIPKNNKVKYLKVDRGRYFYQRRVQKHLQVPLGERFWRRPCVDVDYSKAVQMVVTWGEEHDELVTKLSNPDHAEELENKARRRVEANINAFNGFFFGAPPFYEMTEQRQGEQEAYPKELLPRPWQAASKLMAEVDAIKA